MIYADQNYEGPFYVTTALFYLPRGLSTQIKGKRVLVAMTCDKVVAYDLLNQFVDLKVT